MIESPMGYAARFEVYAKFVIERERIRLRRAEGLPPPWTTDEYLGTYKFCNMRRSADPDTRWICENWVGPHQDDPHLWFAVVVGRWLNKRAVLAELGYPVPFDPAALTAVWRAWEARGEPPFSVAYRTPIPRKGGKKLDTYLQLLNAMWAKRTLISLGTTLASAHRALIRLDGLGDFMAGQVVADLKAVEPLRSAPDWWTWSVPGPGSKEGLNWLLSRPLRSGWDMLTWSRQLARVRSDLMDEWPIGWAPLCAQDVQNSLCELSKLAKVREGRGAVKRYQYKVPMTPQKPRTGSLAQLQLFDDQDDLPDAQPLLHGPTEAHTGQWQKGNSDAKDREGLRHLRV